jgi:hypothetical protein
MTNTNLVRIECLFFCVKYFLVFDVDTDKIEKKPCKQFFVCFKKSDSLQMIEGYLVSQFLFFSSRAMILEKICFN